MTPSDSEQLIDRYEALLPHEQFLLRAMAVIFEPAGLKDINAVLLQVQGPDHREVERADIVRLEQRRLVKSNAGKVRCLPMLIGALTYDAASRGEYPALRGAALQQLPLDDAEYYYTDRAAYQKRRLFYALHDGDHLSALALLGLSSPWDTPGISAESNLLEVAATPLHETLLRTWHPAIRYQVLRPILRASEITWSETKQHFDLLSEIAGEAGTASSVLELYAEQCLLRGKWQQLREVLPRTDLSVSCCLLACLTFFESRDESHETFQQALRRLRETTRKRRILLPGLFGFVYLLALLPDTSKEGRRLAMQQIAVLEKQKVPDPFNGAMWQLRRAREIYEGRQTVSDHGALHHRLTDSLTLLLMGLIHYWSSSTPDESIIAQIQANGRRAENAGYAWFARESAALVNAFADAPDDLDPKWGEPLTALLPRLHDWERSLQALVNVSSNRPAVTTRSAEDATRIAWYLEKRNSDVYQLKPKEQKLRKNGSWTTGRALTLKRLAEESDKLVLSEADLRLCEAIRYNRGYGYYGARANHTLEGPSALLAAVGHPLLFNAANQATSVTAAEPELIVADQGSTIRLTMVPYPFDEELLTVESSATRIEVFSYSPELLQIAQIVTSNGLIVPQAARDKVLESVSTIAPLLTVHSNIEGMTDTVAEPISADPRIYVNLRPQDSGLRLTFHVLPFGAGPMLKPGHGGERLFTEIEGKSLTTSRNLEDERERLESIVQAGPPLYESAPGEWHWDETEDALEGLLALRNLGDEVVLQWPEGQEMKLSKTVGVGNMSVSLRQRMDWFEVDGELAVSPDRVFSMQALLALMRSQSGRFVALGDGEFLTLTDTLKKRLDLLSGLEDQGRIHALNTQNIEAAIEGMQVDADLAWTEQLQRLQQARDFDPVLPTTVEADLRDYQLQGFKWLSRLASWGAGACLADDMGLGKTLQALALMVARASAGPALVLAPTSVIMNWLEEAQRFTPTLNPIRFGDGDRQQVLRELGPYDVLVCSYGLLQSEADALTAVHWHTIVADEAQAFKNAATKRSRAVMALQGDFRMIATGTPIENHLGELWNLFNFINPGLLGKREKFNDRFAFPIENLKDRLASDALRQLISPFILRRLKRDVLTELPPLTEITIRVDLSEAETAFYEALRLEAVSQIDSRDLPANEQRIQALASITRLRRAVCHPSLVSADVSLPSAKLEAFAEIVEELLANRHRALVFSQFVDHLKLIRAHLDDQQIAYRYLDGSTRPAKRREEINAFQSGEADLFLISLKAGGVGLNLTAADYVIHMDPWWNPAVEDQASDRAHRIGQQRPVTVYRLVATNTIEEKIVDLHAHKRDLADSLLEGTEVSARMSVEDMLSLLDTAS